MGERGRQPPIHKMSRQKQLNQHIHPKKNGKKYMGTRKQEKTLFHSREIYMKANFF
jgi:hypothetical protein